MARRLPPRRYRAAAAASNPNWGENLYEANTNPSIFPKERLVFLPRTYRPSVFLPRMFMDPAQTQCAGLEGDAAGDASCNIVINPTQLAAGWEKHFGYLKQLGYGMVVGEFGGNFDWPQGRASIRDRDRWSHVTPGVDAQWQNAFIDYLVSKNIKVCYWSINPESGDTAGWYGHAYDPVTNTAGWGQWQNFDLAEDEFAESVVGKMIRLLGLMWKGRSARRRRLLHVAEAENQVSRGTSVLARRRGGGPPLGTVLPVTCAFGAVSLGPVPGRTAPKRSLFFEAAERRSPASTTC